MAEKGMDEAIQLANDELGCPRCKTELVEGRSTFYFLKVRVGVFDSLKCESCGDFLLTEKGFMESSAKMRTLGLLKLDKEYCIESKDVEIKTQK